MLYTVRLESQTDDQWREMTVDAESPAVAKAIARRAERDLVAFSLIPAEPTEPSRPADGARDATVDDYLLERSRYERDMQAFKSAREGGKAALEALRALYETDDAGKVVSTGRTEANGVTATRRAKAHYHAHHQSEPYKIVSVEPVIPNPLTIVQGLAALHQHGEYWDRTLQAIRDAGLPLTAVTAALAGLTWQKQIDGSSVSIWSSATVQCSLHTAYTFDPDTHDFFNDASATEITGTGYTANGVTLGSKTSTYDTATDQIRLDAADVSWTTSTLSATDALLWVNTAGASSTDPILGNVDFGATVTTTAGTFAITWDATGIIVFDVT
jgi:hypothetical protein